MFREDGRRHEVLSVFAAAVAACVAVVELLLTTVTCTRRPLLIAFTWATAIGPVTRTAPAATVPVFGSKLRAPDCAGGNPSWTTSWESAVGTFQTR